MSVLKKIRYARESDAEQMLGIYQPSVLESPASFETELPSLLEFQVRITEIQKKFPWLVYEIGDEIVGYAYAGPHRTRLAYGWSVDSTVYVKDSRHGKGIGKALYGALFQLVKSQGIVNIFAGITLPNPGSVALHQKMGFVQVGQFKDVGFKLGQWWDVSWWQLQLEKAEKPDRLREYPTSFEIIIS